MRIGGIWHYHVSTSWRSLAMLSAIVLVLFIGILLVMMPFAADTYTQSVNVGSGEVVISHSPNDSPSLSEPFGTSSTIFMIVMIVFASTAIKADRKYLLSNNVTRYEFIIGSFVAAATMALMLTGIQYVLDLIIRAVTYALGFQLRGMLWSPSLVFFSTKNYLPGLVSGIGNMIALSGGVTLIVLLFSRWKKTCITLCVLAVLLPIVMINFLPTNWIDWLLKNAQLVYESIRDFLEQNQWIFLTNASCWRVILQQTTVGAVLYGISYLVIRRLPVRTK